MTNERQEVLQLLGELSELYPDMRIGQLLTWFAGAARQPGVEAVYDVEDEELVEAILSHLHRQKAGATA